jgi:hypothetical protein
VMMSAFFQVELPLPWTEPDRPGIRNVTAPGGLVVCNPAGVSPHSHRAAPPSDVRAGHHRYETWSMADRQQDVWPPAASARQNVVSWRTC